jgi:ubiquinone biosynthesis protein Coq4
MKPLLLSTRERIRSVWFWARGWFAALLLLRNPNRLEEVFALDRALPRGTREQILLFARQSAEGRAALETRPRVHIDLEVLRALPSGTFGRAVADFYDKNGLRPASIPTLAADDEPTYAQAHLYETHDLWHVALGFGTDVAEELGLQAVYAAQLPGRLAPILIAGGLLQAVFWVPTDFGARLSAIARGYSLGTKARPLFGIRWSDLWEVPLDEVRARILSAVPVSASLKLQDVVEPT